MNLNEFKAWLDTITDEAILLGLIDEYIPARRYPWLNMSAQKPSSSWDIDSRVPFRNKGKAEAIVRRLYTLRVREVSTPATCKNCQREFTEVDPYGASKPRPATAEDLFCSGLCQLEHDATKAGMTMYDYVTQQRSAQ